jgi:alkanesulfonate monooxygenase SsuD/methylene tetrahydromethanopterin reductase-like flavin-dependent oxidoreductase (luciferase family)
MRTSLYLYPVMDRTADPATFWTRLATQVDEAHRAGWHGVWTPEHHQARTFFPPPFQILTWCASRYPELVYGTGVALVPLYHPVQFAEAIVTLDSMSGGAVIGVGTGFRRREFDAVGADPQTKVADTRDLLKVVRQLIAGETVTFAIGPWSARESTLSTPAVRQPPILVAARTQAALSVFDGLVDGVIPNPMAGLDRQIELLDSFDEHAGFRAEWRPVIIDFVYADTDDQARHRAARRLGAEFGSFKHHRELVADVDAFCADPINEIDRIRRYSVVGDLAELRRVLADLERRGVTDLLVRAEQADTEQHEVLETIAAVGQAMSDIAAGAHV